MSNKVPVRHLAPLQLRADNIERRVISYRPARSGLPNVSAHLHASQIIGYNYGHSGSGWTLAPGSAQHLVDQIEQLRIQQQLPLDSQVTIVGAGIIGLMTAYEFIQRGYTTIVIVADQFTNLVSENAAGLVMPSPLIAADTDNGRWLRSIAINSWQWYLKILNRTHPHFECGARTLSAYYGQRQPAFETLADTLMKPGINVTIDFSNGTRIPSVVYDNVLFVDVYAMLQQIKNYLINHGVSFEQRHIHDIAQLTSPITIVCAGLGAKKLAHDKGVRSIQGHQLVLKNQDARIADYVLSFDIEQGKAASGHDVNRSLYFHPKQFNTAEEHIFGVLGTTHVQGAGPETPNEEEFELMLQRALKFFNGK